MRENFELDADTKQIVHVPLLCTAIGRAVSFRDEIKLCCCIRFPKKGNCPIFLN